jgi:protein-tyrosine phosphatase
MQQMVVSGTPREIRVRQQLDVTRLINGLYMGSRPPLGDTLSDAGFDALLLCAYEFQPRSSEIPNVRIYHVPLDDNDERPLTLSEKNQILAAGSTAASLVQRGARCLITCAMGRNRSGVVSAVALSQLSGRTPREAAQFIRKVRVGRDGGAPLMNDSFNEFLDEMSG